MIRRLLVLSVVCLALAAPAVACGGLSAPTAPTVKPTAAATGPVGVFVWDGNSLTQSRNGAVAMPVNVMHDLGDPPRLQYVNAGQSGHTTTEMLTTALALVDPQYRPGQLNLLGVWEGANDLYFGATVDVAYAHLRDYCAARKRVGFTVVLLTLMPRNDAGRPATYETSRLTVNDELRATWSTFADVLVDVGADPIMGDPAQTLAGVYFSPIDRVHLTDAGSQRVAGLVRDAGPAMARHAREDEDTLT